jgi:4-hydroxybenzoate polyprenyltransferase/phosphoserine phosphatase
MEKESSVNCALCVDLDGTLVKTDLLWESLCRALKNNPLVLVLLPFWLARGIAHLKLRLAERAQIDYGRLPYNTEILEYIKCQPASRKIILCTGSHKLLADRISKHLGIFDAVFATENTVNFTGSNKAKKLVENFGEREFDYIGNERKDYSIWAVARKALVVSSSNKFIAEARSRFEVETAFKMPAPDIRLIMKTLRVHQWVKNLLIFVPLILDGRVFDYGAFAATLAAFFAFSFVASATYILNDFLDLDSDRAHVKKCHRPFAAGRISIATGCALIVVFLLAGLLLCLATLPFLYLLVLAVYIVCTLLYSFKLKTVAMLDVCLLAGLYTIRVIAGTIAISAGWSFWLLAFAMFLFMSLALVKRSSELYNLAASGGLWAKGRGYHVDDLPLINAMGVASGFVSVLVVALYINSEKVTINYAQPEMLWVVCPSLLYWISRIWLVTSRGGMNEDPILFAIRDRISWILALVCFATINISVYIMG